MLLILEDVTFSTLKKLNSSISPERLSNAKKIINPILKEYVRKIPPSKTAISQDVKRDIIQFIVKNSETHPEYSSKQIKYFEFEITEYSKLELYHYYSTKSALYN